MNRIPFPVLLIFAVLFGWLLNSLFSPESQEGSTELGSVETEAVRAAIENTAASEGESAKALGSGALVSEATTTEAVDAVTMAARIQTLSNAPSISNARETLELISGLSQDGLRELLLSEPGGRGMSDGMVSNLAFMAWVDRDHWQRLIFTKMNYRPGIAHGIAWRYSQPGRVWIRRLRWRPR